MKHAKSVYEEFIINQASGAVDYRQVNYSYDG